MKKNYLFFLVLILFGSVVRGQITNAVTYDFTDGTIIAAKQSTDGKLTLGGAYSWHNNSPSGYGLNLKLNQEINISVSGSCTIRFLGSKYSGLKLTGTSSTAVNLGTMETKVVNDKVDTYEFVYSGLAAVLNFKAIAGTGNDIYLPKIEVIPAQLGKNFTSAEKNIAYSFDLRDQSIISATYPGNTYELGLFKIDAGASNAYAYHGTQHGIYFKNGNKITLKVAGNSYIRVATDQYSGGTIKATSTTGSFDVTTVNNNTGTTFSNGAPTYVDILYVGTAGTVTLESVGGTNYLPYIEVSPVPYPVSLSSYVQKTGTIVINGTTINLQSGIDVASNATVGVSAGTVISATSDKASVRINLNGSALSTFTPAVTGDIASVSVNSDVMTVTYANSAADPKTYSITIKDNSIVPAPEFGKTYTYNFANGSEMPQTAYTSLRYNTFVTNDGMVTIKSNTATDAVKFGFHDAAHGGVFYAGNSFDVAVAGNATITVIACTYGSPDAFLEFRDASNNLLGTIRAQNNGLTDAQPYSFSYTGAKGIITAKLTSAANPTAEIYIHGMSVENAAQVIVSNGKTDVWDFGATQLDGTLYNNKLTQSAINSWYLPSVAVGSNGNVLPSFSAGVLSWVGGSNDRLRTLNTNLTRYDENASGTTDYQGRVYVNGAAAVGRYMSLTLSEDDEVTVVVKTDADGIINFEYVGNPAEQTDKIALASTITELKFVAKKAGTYHIFDTKDKPSYYRIYRKDADYVNLTGAIDVTQANGIPNGYNVQFTNAAGKVFPATITSGSYTAKLPAGYTYNISLSGANGYVINNGSSLQVLKTTTNHDVVIEKVQLYTVSGTITGLGTKISNVALKYTAPAAANKIYVPVPVINTTDGSYTVNLEPNTAYTISAENINDYELLANTITITGNTNANVAFTLKPAYPITINTTGLNATQISNLKLTFTNLNESGYVYNFNSVSGITLRNGTYSISSSGLDSTVKMALTSNLNVANAATSKTLDFVSTASSGSISYAPVLAVGSDKPYKTINAALVDVARMTRTATDRVTVMIDPGNYEEMLVINQANVTLKNAASTPNIKLLNKGVDIDGGAVRITSYYGHGYNYYSMSSDQKWHADVLKVNKENGYLSYENKGSGTTNGSYWNATVVVAANGFEANDIIFENSFNQYISKKESEDVVVMWTAGSKGARPTDIGNTEVQKRSFVERAAAIAILNNIDKVILNKCRVVGRQDSFYGGTGARVVAYKGVMMGAVDYIFGGMNAVFYKTDLSMNTSDTAGDQAYITAPQQSSGRGYLMYECKVTTAIPGTETASVFRSKPGYFGRPWQATTSEVVFYNTTIETSNFTGSENLSLIVPAGWNDSLGGQSAKMYEFGTIENSGVNNASGRVAWSTKLAAPSLTDGTAITTLNFTKGSDGWDPLPQLISNENLGVKDNTPTSAVNVIGYKNRIAISNVKSETAVAIYTITGSKVKTFKTAQDIDFEFQTGAWIVVIKAEDGQKVVKIITH
jgi:pectin methylesterase-like acyl-CoA thioesterase